MLGHCGTEAGWLQISSENPLVGIIELIILHMRAFFGAVLGFSSWVSKKATRIQHVGILN